MAKTFEVGATFLHKKECDRYRPIYYAGASGDFNPIHIDSQMGEAAGLNGAILQGLCTMAWAAEAASTFLDDPGKIRRVKVRFSRPVAIDDVISFEGVVAAREGSRVTLNLTAKNQKGDEVLKGALVEAEI